VKNGNL